MLQPLDGPGINGNISVTTTPSEARVGGTTLEDRAVITVQPIDGVIYYGYDNSVSSTNGTKIFKGQIIPFEAGPELPIFLVAESGTVDVRITEVG